MNIFFLITLTPFDIFVPVRQVQTYLALFDMNWQDLLIQDSSHAADFTIFSNIKTIIDMFKQV